PAKKAAAAPPPPVTVDTHADTPSEFLKHPFDLGVWNNFGMVDYPRMKAGAVDAEFFAAYVPAKYANKGAAAYCMRIMETIHEMVDGYPAWAGFATSTSDIRRIASGGKRAILIGIEGGHAIEDSLDTLRDFYARGARYMTLTHVNTNNWCDSSGDAARHGGITDFGREIIRTMNDLGMIVDISHVSDAAFYQVVETTRVPLVATHSSCRALCRHPRNMTDDMLRDLARNGGVCMINFFSAFISDEVAQVIMNAQKRSKGNGDAGGTEEMPNDRTDWDSYLEWFNTLGCPQATLAQVVDHIMHAADVAGIDHVGIGSDFDGVPALPAGLQTAAGLPGITEELLRRGMTAGDVEKILGGNFLRVFEAIERGARR
ncbi:MAG TPA: dipeptidase, partial [Thermoanaerobaculia bacterium]|nr:dipeptidase [Thermoanaerobaculia bacterium]